MTSPLKKALFPLFIGIAVFAGIFIGFQFQATQPGQRFFRIQDPNPVQEIMSLIRNRYVDDVNAKKIGDSAIQAILAQLDPHSAYIPAASLQAVNNDIKGSFYGIGIGYDMIEDTLHVISILDDSPASRDGILVGDKLLKAGDSALSGVKKISSEILDLISGEKGSVVTLTLLRNGKILKIPITRDEIKISSVDAAFIIQPGVGFMRLNRFSTKTYHEFMVALEDLKSKGMKKLILDLRDNGGGVLDEAVEIADEFLPGDKLIAYTQGKHSNKKEFRSRRQGQFETGKLVVLVNEGTASASEILAGALQDWDRATIIGRGSFGKGLVQEQYNLSDGSALRLTVSRYYTPLGRSLQRSYAAGKKAYYEEIYQPKLKDTASHVGEKIFLTPAGKKLYEHSGILPDVMVASDTNLINPTLLSLYRKGIFKDFGYLFYTSDSTLVKKYKMPSVFNDSFKIDEKTWLLVNKLIAKDTSKKIILSTADKTILTPILKNAVANQIFKRNGYFQVIAEKDSTIQKALQLIK